MVHHHKQHHNREMLNSLLLTFRFHLQTQGRTLGVKVTNLSTLLVMEKAKNMATLTDKTEQNKELFGPTHPASRAFLKLLERKGRLFRNRVKSLLSMSLLLLGYNLELRQVSKLARFDHILLLYSGLWLSGKLLRSRKKR